MLRILFVPLIFIGFFYSANAQHFNGSLTVGYGYFNEKVRLQYEHPLNNRLTVGGNVNYYLVNWKGPIIEPFFRFYNKSGNEDGFFGQVKLGYGNLTTAYAADEAQYVINKRMNTFGAGLGYGYKYLFDDRFVFETFLGVRYYSYTPTQFNDQYYSLFDVESIKSVVWYLTTGLPVEANFRIGYQF
jgi:hypothetical protein